MNRSETSAGARVIPRWPSCKPPVSRYRFRDFKRWRARWDQYRDACVMAECLYQGSLGTSRSGVHLFRAFYGVEGKFVLPVLSPGTETTR